MRVFIPVFFQAPLGGLQSHVMAQARALLRAGCGCTVMCRPGPFAQWLGREGVPTLTTDFANVAACAAQAFAAGPFDLVHAHPFAARQVGLEVARRLGVPFVMTLHTSHLDELDTYAIDVDLLLTVSSVGRDFVLAKSFIPPERVMVMPNGVDTGVFHRVQTPWPELVRRLPALAPLTTTAADARVLLVTRMDKDKRLVLDLVRETWALMAQQGRRDLVWLVAGDGTARAEMEAAGEELSRSVGRKLVAMLGWQEEGSLTELTSAADVVVAPGRSVLEAMACGTPVVAVGSRGYTGPVDGDAALRGVMENFGGAHSDRAGYTPGTMLADITRIGHAPDARERLGRLGLACVDAFYRQDRLDERLLGLYRMLCAMPPRNVRCRASG